MAQGTFRVLGTKSVPKLLEKVNQIDIVNDLITGGSGVPASAEMAKQLSLSLNAETGARVQADLDIKGGASVNYSSLKKIEDVIIAGVATDAAALDAAIVLVNASVAAEAGTRLANDNILQSNITAEAVARDAAIATEASARMSADASITASLTQEIADRTTADNNETIAREIDIAAVNAAIAQEIANRTTADNAEALLRATNDTALQANIDTEATTRAANDATEVAARTSADTMLDGKIGNETAERLAADAYLTNLLNDETTARVSYDALHDNRLSLIESGYVTGAKLKGTVPTVADLDFVATEEELQAGWFYVVVSGTTNTRDVYMAADGISGDYKPLGWTTKSFIWLMDYADVSNAVAAEKSERMLADDLIRAAAVTLNGKVDANKVLTDNAIATVISDFTNADAAINTAIAGEALTRLTADNAEAASRAAADVTLQANVDGEVAAREAAIFTESGARALADTNLQANIDAEALARTNGIADEAATRAAADASGAAALAAEVINRDAAIASEAATRTTADGILQAAIDAEILARSNAVTAEAVTRAAADTATSATLNTIQGDSTVVGSIAKAELDAKIYASDYMPQPKLEGQDGMLIVTADQVGLIFAPISGLSGISMGEAVVFLANGDSVMVSILNVTGTAVTLATTVPGEYDGLQVKIQYWYRNIDQVGLGGSLLGTGPLGA